MKNSTLRSSKELRNSRTGKVQLKRLFILVRIPDLGIFLLYFHLLPVSYSSASQICLIIRLQTTLLNTKFSDMDSHIDVGTGEHWGHLPLKRFCNEQRSALEFSENSSFFLRKKCPQGFVPPKFEILATSDPGLSKETRKKLWTVIKL